MKWFILIVKILIGVTFLIVCFYCIRHPFLIAYEGHYYEKVGIKRNWRYDDIVQKKGTPKYEEIKDNFIYAHYEGLELQFVGKQHPMEAVRITGRQYRFGLWRIGVGSTRKEVESVYRNVTKMKGVRPGEFGVIDGGVWVYFYFDENDIVSLIILTRDL